MLESKEYVAIQNFSMSLDNGKIPINVKKGEILEFDGLNVVIRGEKGTLRSLSKVIGEWIEPVGVRVTHTKTANLARPPRNVTGGRILEHSDYTSDPEVGVKNQSSDNLNNLLKTYERMPETKIVNGKREVTGDMEDIKKEVTVINSDVVEARKVNAPDGAPVTNKMGVEIEVEGTAKSKVMSREGQVAKETNYSGKEASDDVSKKLVLDYEASGVVVKRTGTQVTQVKAQEKVPVNTVETDIEVSETSYPASSTTDVGSSTQAHLEQGKSIPKKVFSKKKKPTKKGKSKSASSKKVLVPKAASVQQAAPTVDKVIRSYGQEAVIISKVSMDDSSVIKSKDGITSKVTIGANSEVDTGEVKFSSSSDYEEPGVTITAGDDTPVEIAGDELDLNDILSDE